MAFVSYSQDTIRYDTVIFKSPYKAKYNITGYWVFKPDTIFNIQGPYKLRVHTVDLNEGPDKYFYYSYGKIVTVIKLEKSVIVMDRFRKQTTVYKHYGLLRYFYFSF